MASRIVVGVDGSEASIAALSWAIQEASLRDSPIVVVHAWQVPYAGDVVGMVATVRPEDLDASGNEVLDHSISAAGPIPPEVRLERLVSSGSPAGVLVELAEQDDIIVVGTRGRGGFTGLLLGSVSQQTVHHARCPVVIVPKPAEPDG